MQFDDTGARRQRQTAPTGAIRPAAFRHARVLAALLALWLPLAAAANDAPDPAAQVRSFDIPAQPLPEALQLYGEMTGVAVLIDAHLLGGLRSAPVRGNYPPPQALHLLLDGTGLAPRFVEGGAFTLVAAQPAAESTAQPSLAGVPGAAAEAARRRAAHVIQRGLEQALCGSRLTRPGSYRVSLRFWLDPDDNRIRDPQLLDSSGRPERDAAVLQRLRGLALPGLPSDLPQPVTLLLLPHTAGATAPCRRAP